MGRVDNLYLWSEIQCAEVRPEQEAAVPNGSVCSRVWEQSPARAYKLACQGLWLNLIKEGVQELDICVWRTQDHQATPLSEPPNRRRENGPSLCFQCSSSQSQPLPWCLSPAVTCLLAQLSGELYLARKACCHVFYSCEVAGAEQIPRELFVLLWREYELFLDCGSSLVVTPNSQPGHSLSRGTG